MPEYPRVERAHIVPRTYLRNFADGEEMVGMRLVDPPSEERRISINDAAIRKRFYRRERPDGTPIDDVEHSLSILESAVGPLLRGLEDNWPPSGEDKAVLAEFFALQILRGVHWRESYNRRAERLVDDYRERGLFSAEIEELGLTLEEARDRNLALFTSDTFRLRRMLGMLPKGASVLCSMIWALVRFDRPCLATSDHPVTGWSRFEASSRAKRTHEGLGLINAAEWRVPVSSTAAVLMTWLPQHDDIEQPVCGGRREARNLNSFSVANADKQRFNEPGQPVSLSLNRSFRPLSFDLFTAYDLEAVENSVLRVATQERVNARLGEEGREFEVVKYRPPAGPGADAGNL